MKLLMFYTHKWWFKTAAKTLLDEPDDEREDEMDAAAVVFFHAEAHALVQRAGVLLLTLFSKNCNSSNGYRR